MKPGRIVSVAIIAVILFGIHELSQWDGWLDERERIHHQAILQVMKSRAAFVQRMGALEASTDSLLQEASESGRQVERVREIRVEVERQIVPFSGKAELLGLRPAPDGWLADSSTVERLDGLRIQAQTVPLYKEEINHLESQVGSLESVVRIQRTGWDEALARVDRLDSLIVEGERIRKARRWRNLFGSTAKCGAIGGLALLAGLEPIEAGAVGAGCGLVEIIF